MVVEIIGHKNVAGHDFLDGQQYKALGITYAYPEPPCTNCTSLSKHYSLVVEGHIAPILFPADRAAVLNKEEPDEDMRSRIQVHYDAMTEDAVVKDGDYATAILDRLNTDINKLGPDFDGESLRKLEQERLKYAESQPK